MAKIYKKNSFLHRNSGSYAIFVDREIIFLRKTSEHDEKNTKRIIPLCRVWLVFHHDATGVYRKRDSRRKRSFSGFHSYGYDCVSG